MSIPKKMTVKCSKCGAEIEVTVFESVNTDYAENITEQITSGALFDAKCDKCGFVSHLEYDVLYHDVKHGAMIWVLHDNLPEYSNRVAELRRSANILGYKTTRIVSNMNELRQKVACLENGRDDRIIELCKVFLVYNLLSQQPDFDFNNAFYTTFLGEERVFFYDKNGQDLSCELTEDTYSLLRDLYYNSEYASEFESYYALVDYDWAERIIHPLLKQEAERIDAEDATESASANGPTTAEKGIVCPSCKQTLPEDSVFCHYCGTEIPQGKKCIYCDAELADDMKFCAMCGKQVNEILDQDQPKEERLHDNSRPQSYVSSVVSTPATQKTGVSKPLFIVVSCVCAVAIVCSCVLGYLYRKNYNIAVQNFDVVEGLKTKIDELESELAQLDSANDKLRSTNERLTDRISELNEAVSTNSKKAELCDEYLVFVPSGTNVYHKYDCEKWNGTYSIYASWQLDNVNLRACPYCH